MGEDKFLRPLLAEQDGLPHTGPLWLSEKDPLQASEDHFRTDAHTMLLLLTFPGAWDNIGAGGQAQQSSCRGQGP